MGPTCHLFPFFFLPNLSSSSLLSFCSPSPLRASAGSERRWAGSEAMRPMGAEAAAAAASRASWSGGGGGLELAAWGVGRIGGGRRELKRRRARATRERTTAPTLTRSSGGTVVYGPATASDPSASPGSELLVAFLQHLPASILASRGTSTAAAGAGCRRRRRARDIDGGGIERVERRLRRRVGERECGRRHRRRQVQDIDGGGGRGTSTAEASSRSSSRAPAVCGRARVQEEAPAATT